MKIYLIILILLLNSICATGYKVHSLDFIGFEGIQDSISNATSVQPDDSTEKKTVSQPFILHKDFSAYNPDLNFIDAKIKQFKDYRFAGDLLNYLPFGFLTDLGWLGQPAEVKFYNLGFNNVTYLNNGINYNNRLTNSLDVNFLQTENLDFIGVSPLPRGFLFGNFNNPVSVILKSKESTVSKPYSKIRFYQAKNEEAYINGVFKTRIFRKLYGSFEFTNNAIDNGFKNTGFSSWMVTSALKYLILKYLNFTLRYNHVRSYTGLFGGVNYDSIKSTTGITNPEDVLYNRILAPVEFDTRYKKNTAHNFELETLLKLSQNSLTDFNLYYQYRSVKFRQNEKGKEKAVKTIFNDDNYNTYGLNFSHRQLFGKFSAYFFANYEKIKNNITDFIKDSSDFNKYSFLSYGAVLSADLLDGYFAPSVFVKQLHSDLTGKNYFGFGADANFNLGKHSTIYLGYSNYAKPLHVFATLLKDNATVNNFEVKYIFKTTDVKVSAGYFSYSYSKKISPLLISDDNSLKTVETIGYNINSHSSNSGVHLLLNYHTWKVLTELNANYYFGNDKPDSRFTLFSGLYYVDTLFQSNLHLKAGVNFKLFNISPDVIYDFEKSTSAPYYYSGNNLPGTPDVETKLSYQTDIFVAGEIQEAATVYFVLENVFDTKYYLIKYYPKQEMTFRFGFSWEFLN